MSSSSSSRMRMRALAVAALLVVGAGCHETPIVGLLCPVSGARSAYGKAVRDGAQLAVDEAPAGTLPRGFKVLDADSASTADGAVQGLKKLLDGKACLVVGGVTDAELAAMVPVLDHKKKICLSPTADDARLSQKSKYVFRIFPAADLEAQTDALHLEEKAGVHRLLLMTDGSPFALAVEAEFRKHYTLKMGGRIIGAVTIGEEGWKVQTSDLCHAHDPQGVFVIGYAQPTLEALRVLHRQEFDGVRCVTSALYVGDVMAANRDLTNNLLLALPTYDVRSTAEPMKPFVAAFRARYKRTPDLWAANGYDAMRVALAALRSSSSLYSPELLQAMHFGLRDLQGVTGAIAFNDFGEVSRFPVMYAVRDGEVISYRALVRQEVEKARKEVEDFLRRHGAPVSRAATPTPKPGG